MSNTLKLGNGKWATGKDTVLSFSDTNNNFKPLPFDYSRASSATVVNQSGLIETVGSGTPRIDFLGNTKGALLLEPSRTNSITYSEDFSQWTNAGTTTVLSNITNPSGGLQSYLLSATSSSTNALRYDFSFSASTNYCYSLFFKDGTSQEVRMQLYDGSSFFRLAVNPLNNFEVVDQQSINSYLIEDFTNGWKRISINITTSASASAGYLQIYPDRTGNLNNVYLYGAQLEQGSYATSYIPTSGQSGGVTRVGDACNNENLNVDYSGDYTLYLEHETLSITEYNQFQFRQETSISYIFRVGNSINVGSGLYSATNTIGFNKFALSVGSDGSYSFYKNGSLLSSGSGLNANLETLKGDAVGMSIKDIKLYNTRLSNAELQALTTI